MLSLVTATNRFLKDKTAAGMAEYILIIVLIAIFMIWSIRMYSGKLRAAYIRAGDAIASNGECCTGHPGHLILQKEWDRLQGGSQ